MGEPIDFGRLFGAVITDEGNRANELYQGGRLALTDVNVLAQPRRTFEDIALLADDIAEKGVLNPPTVACLSPEQAALHVATVGVLYETQYDLEDLRFLEAPHGQVCYILLAGERRFRAHRHLWERGCSKCLETYGQEPPGTCFTRHIESSKMEVRLCLGINVLRALFLQLSENTHVSVPAYEEADAYARLFRLLKHHDPEYPLALFARKVGRSEETIRRALKYVELPVSVRALVERTNGPRMPYGAAIELARLRDGLAAAKEGARPLDEEDLLIEARMFFARGQSLKAFSEYIRDRIKNASSGQLGLFGEIDPAQDRKERRKDLLLAVSRATDRSLTASLGYAATARSVLERGSSKAFSLRGPVRQLLRMSRELVRAIAVQEQSAATLSIAAVVERDDQAASLARELQRLFMVLEDELPETHRLEIVALLASAHHLLELDEPPIESASSR